MNKQFMWIEEYRPKAIEDIILPSKTLKIIKQFIKEKSIPHLLLSTKKPGLGKTSLAYVIMNELNADRLVINGSIDGNIDILKNNIDRFASTISTTGGRKVVLIDEADHLSGKFSDAMRGVLEKYHKNCSFIFTCNNIEKLIEPIRSRFQLLSFEYDKEEKVEAKIKIYKRLEKILNEKEVKFKETVLMDIINKKFPDIRSMIGLLQLESRAGDIDTFVLDRIETTDIDYLFSIIKEKKFTELRQFVANQYVNDFNIYRQLFDSLDTYLVPDSIPLAILLLNEAQYKHSFMIDKEINLIASLTELMKECKVK